MTMHKAICPRDNIDFMSQEKKEEVDSSAVNTAWMHQNKDSKTSIKHKDEDEVLQQPDTPATTQG